MTGFSGTNHGGNGHDVRSAFTISGSPNRRALSAAERAFARRRRRTTFASPVIAHKAKLVESDLHLLAACGRRIPAIQQLVLQNIAEFEAMLRTHTMGQ